MKSSCQYIICATPLSTESVFLENQSCSSAGKTQSPLPQSVIDIEGFLQFLGERKDVARNTK